MTTTVPKTSFPYTTVVL